LRPVLGLASRQFEAALSGAEVTKGDNKQERAAEKEKQKEREPAKDGSSSPKREAGLGGRRKEDDDEMRRACCSSAAWRLICSYNPPSRGQVGPATRVAASSANGRYVGRSVIYRR